MILPEIGVNWNWSNLDERMGLIRDAGASFVKGQLFYPDQAPEKFKDIALYEWEKIDRWKEAARKADLIPVFTPMHVGLVRFADRHHLKIRFKDRYNLPLIRAAQAHAQTVWVSGWDRLPERGIYRPAGPRPVLCVPSYPATFKDYEEAFMAKPQAKDHDRTLWEGISSHLEGDVGDLIRLAEECDMPKDGYFEAHVAFETSDPEYPWSIPPEQLKELVQWGDAA